MTTPREPIGPIELMELVFKGDPKTLQFLKCDAEGCPYQEYHHEIDETLIDKPCPNCGENLMTADQYERFKK